MNAEEIYHQFKDGNTLLGDIKKMAKQIKKDHELAMALWGYDNFHTRMLAVLILDKKFLTQAFMNELTEDIEKHPQSERTQIIDWLMANQLTKSKKTIGLMESWQDSSYALQRRLFWYYQGRLRWRGQEPPANSKQLVDAVEKGIATEAPEVQWAMNFTAGQIGIHQVEFRERLVSMGKKLALYKEQKVSKGCTPNYLPEYIRIEAEKWGK